MTAIISGVFVGGSGKSLIIRCADAGSAPSRINGLVTTTSERIKVAGGAGTFLATFNGQTTSALPRGVTATDLQTALLALSSVGAGNLTVIGPAGGPWLTTFSGTLGTAPQPLLSLDTSSLSANAASTPTTAGTTPAQDLDDATSAWTGIGPWVSHSGGFGSGVHKECVAQGFGDNSCTWQATGLAAGYYRIFFGWGVTVGTSLNAYTTAAPLRVFDGTTWRADFTVDQTQTIIREDPYDLMSLGNVYIGSGTFNLVMRDETTGILSANLVTLAPVDPLAPVANSQYFDTAVYTGTWHDLGGNYGHLVKHTYPTTAAGDKAVIAVRGLQAGSFDAFVTWETWNGTRSTQATYRIFDGNGTSPVLTAVVDQNQAPTADVVLRTANFQRIGSVTGTSGWFRVELTAPDSASTTLCMDAAAFGLISAPPRAETVTSVVSFISSGRQPSIRVDGGSPLTLTRPFFHQPSDFNDYYTLSTLYYPLDSLISPSSQVTFSIDDNVLTTIDGTVSGVTDFAVTNRSGGTILPAAPDPTMQIGYVLKPVGSPWLLYTDLMKMAYDWQPGPGANISLDAHGYPVFENAGYALTVILGGPPNSVDPRGYPCGDWGLYTVWFDGNGDGLISFYVFDGTLGTVFSSDTGHATNNKIVWQFSPDPSTQASYGPTFALIMHANSPGSPFTNIRIYDPSINQNALTKFHPKALAQLEGVRSLRSTFILGANNTAIAEWDDYAKTTQRSYGAGDFNRKNFTIVSVSQCNDVSGFLATTKLHALITLDRPHGLRNGCAIEFLDQTVGPPILITLASGPTFGMNGYAATVYRDPNTMTTSQFAVIIDSPDNSSTISPAWTGGGIVSAFYVSIPPADFIELVNLLPDCSAHVGVPAPASDDLVTQMFTMVGAQLEPGRKLYLEVSNEHWNIGNSYPQYWFFAGVTQQLALTWPSGAPYIPPTTGSTPGYTVIVGHIQSVALLALGARAGDLIPLYGSVAPSAGTTDIIVNTADFLGFPVGAVAIAPYAENLPDRESAFAPYAASLNADQVIDNAERVLLDDRLLTNYCIPHVESLRAKFPSAEFVGYEGSYASVAIGGDDTVYALQNQAVWHHPRFYNVLTYYFGMLQRGGMTRFNFYSLSGPFQREGSDPSVIYGAIQAWNMQPGLNNGSDLNGYNVLSDIGGSPPGIANQKLSNSVPAYAIANWNSRSSIIMPTDAITQATADYQAAVAAKELTRETHVTSLSDYQSTFNTASGTFNTTMAPYALALANAIAVDNNPTAHTARLARLAEYQAAFNTAAAVFNSTMTTVYLALSTAIAADNAAETWLLAKKAALQVLLDAAEASVQ